jgi:hypothetical protein
MNATVNESLATRVLTDPFLEAGPKALASDILNDPLSLIEVGAVLGGACRDKARALLGDAWVTANAQTEAETGKSLLETALPRLAKRVQKSRKGGKNWHDTPMHIWWPYCIRRLENGSYLPLGRNYEPLGHCEEGRVYDYEQFASQAWTFTCDPLKLDGVWCPHAGAPYLYSGERLHSLREFEDYLTRFGRLLTATGEHAPFYLAPMLRSLPPEKGGVAPQEPDADDGW